MKNLEIEHGNRTWECRVTSKQSSHWIARNLWLLKLLALHIGNAHVEKTKNFHFSFRK